MTFRNTIARRALENVREYMRRFSVNEAEAHVEFAFNYHGEVPFLYRTFKPTDKVEPDLKKEPGGYKVISRPIPILFSLTTLIFCRSVVDFSAITSFCRRC